MKEGIECYEGSGNVFADIGLEDADECLVRAQIGVEVLKILKDHKLKQREIIALFGIKQAEMSHLMNGHFNNFSIGSLFAFLNALGYDIEIRILEKPASRERGQVRVVAD